MTDLDLASFRLVQTMAGARHGGAEAFFERLALAFDRAGVQQTLAVGRRAVDRVERLRAAGLSLMPLPFGGWFDVTTRPALRRLMAEVRPQIALAWMNRAAKLTPRPPDGLLIARLGGYYDPKYYRQCDYLIANTADIRRWLIDQGFAEDRVAYIPNFVEATPVDPLPRASLLPAGVPNGAPLLLCLGRLHRNKAFDTALAALAQVPAAQLLIAGDGPELPTLKALAAKLGIGDRVHFLGWRQDGPALLATADLLLCPSRHEPLGNVVLEGWAHGCPVIAARSQGPSALIRDGETGLLVPVDDADALAGAIRLALGNQGLRQSLAAGGRAALDADFSEAAVVRQYLAFFARCLARQTRS